jgi:cytochrome bd-type quinol oxidase subunit 2
MYGGRSDGLVVLISTLFFFYLWLQLTHSRGDLRYSMRSGLMICALLLVPLFLLYVIYAQSGALGKAAKMQIDLAKNPYNPVEVLLLARNESVIALDAIY